MCHHRDAYNPGVRLIPENMHRDIEKARQTVAKLAELNREYANVVVILAHELQRKKEMPFFPQDLAGWVANEVERGKRSWSGVICFDSYCFVDDDFCVLRAALRPLWDALNQGPRSSVLSTNFPGSIATAEASGM